MGVLSISFVLFLLLMIIKQSIGIKNYKLEEQRKQTELRDWLLFIIKEQELALFEVKKSGDLTKSIELNNYLESTCRSAKLYLIHDLKLSKELINKYKKYQKGSNQSIL